MHMTRRGLMLGSGTGLLLAGCGSRTSRTPVAEWPTEVPTEPTTITWWSAAINAADGGDLRGRMVEAFQQRYPNITVQLVRAPQDTNTNRASLTTQIAAGSPSPDVYLGDVAWPGQFAHNKLAVPLDTLVAADVWDSFDEGLRTAARYDGSYYMLPVYIDESFLFYRQDLLAKHGLAVPASWEEVAQTSKVLIDAGDVDSGFIYQGSVYEGLTCSIVEFVADAGGQVVGPDATSAAIDSSEGRRALEFLADLVGTGVTPRAALTYIEQSSMDAFASGRAAFLRNWSYALDTANAPDVSAVAGKVGAVVRPGFDGLPGGNSTIGGWGNYLNPHTENPAAALAFAAFCAGEEGQQLLVTEGAVIPARTASLTSPEAEQTDRAIYDVAKGVTLQPRPTATPYYPNVSESIYTQANAVIAGQRDVADGTASMASGIDDALAGEAL